MKIAMRPAEIELLRSYLTQAKSYCEFGTGGSTVFADTIVDGPIYSIDSSKEWLDKVRAELSNGPHERKLIHVDIGPTGDWGVPLVQGSDDKFLNYHDRVWSQIDRDFDFYLVDGRFRVACFAQILKRLPPSSSIAFHDYANRPRYHVIEEIATLKNSAGNLAIFEKNDAISSTDIDRVLDMYKFNSA